MPVLPKQRYDECFWSALRRVAIYMNSDKGQLCSKSWLALSDDEIAEIFKKRELDSKLVSYQLSKAMIGDDTSRIPDDMEKAEHDFYGKFQFHHRNKPNRIHVTYFNTEAFRDWSLEGLYMPKTSSVSFAELKKIDNKTALAMAGTNYLVKNFGHNTAHKKFQLINELNFHAFGGDARYESDFTADNIANIMLLRAYGLNITVKGREPSVETQQKIRDLFAINRCNRLFVERAERRQEQQSELGSFQERMWHFKRQLANQLSVALVIEGAAVSDIAVYFTGRIRTRTEDKRGGHYHDGKVVVRVNGIYIETGLAPYLEDHRNKQTAAERLKAINERRTQRLDDIVTFCKTAYLKELKAHSWLREYAQSTLNALEHRLQA